MVGLLIAPKWKQFGTYAQLKTLSCYSKGYHGSANETTVAQKCCPNKYTFEGIQSVGLLANAGPKLD